MGAVNVTVRVDEDTKKEFDSFCENVGINMTTAFNMFIKATLRTRQLPFPITDVEPQTQTRQKLKRAFATAQEQTAINGMSNMSMEDIDEEIAACRREKSDSK